MTAGLRDEDVVEVAAGVHLVHGSDTNWVVVKDGDAATLIDSGYPGDRDAVLASLARLGVAPEAVRAVLITHAHGDHIGAAEHLRTAYGTDVLMHEEEVPHARREFLHQVTIGKILARAWRPGVRPLGAGRGALGGTGRGARRRAAGLPRRRGARPPGAARARAHAGAHARALRVPPAGTRRARQR